MTDRMVSSSTPSAGRADPALVLDGTRVAQLARDNAIGTSTAYDYLDEGFTVLAAQAPALESALLAGDREPISSPLTKILSAGRLLRRRVKIHSIGLSVSESDARRIARYTAQLATLPRSRLRTPQQR